MGTVYCPRVHCFFTLIATAGLAFGQQANSALHLTMVSEGFSDPTQIVSPRDHSDRMLVVEQAGTIRAFSLDSGAIYPEPFLDIRSRVFQRPVACCDEEGLLGLAFPLDEGPKDHCFVFYVDADRNIIISRFEVDPVALRADPSSEKILQTVPHPLRNHFSGTISFNPADGLLWLGIGDGSQADAVEESQNPDSVYGKILRFNPYNPEAKLEVMAIGLRNPWRISFDSANGDLYIGDVGENTFEEVNFMPAGAPNMPNFGWGVLEGYDCYDFIPCEHKGMTPPIFVFDHDSGCSVTGGEVYRGFKYPSLYGKYLFGDLCNGRIWASHRDESGEWNTNLLADMDEDERVISSFGLDQQGEIYYAEYIRGQIWRIDAAEGSESRPALVTRKAKPFPKRIKQTR